MRRQLPLVVAACLWSGALAGLPALADDPANEPDTCRHVWKAVGLPEMPEDADENPVIVCHEKYVIGHSSMKSTPVWVIEHLTRATVSGKNTRPGNTFSEESHLPRDIPRAGDRDYKGSNFDRGHQAPSADYKSSVELMEDTFFYSNVVPQEGKGFNQGIWKRLEALVAKLAASRGEIYVITGPIFQEKNAIRVKADADACGTPVKLSKLSKASIGSNEVAVPAALYKIIYAPDLGRLNAYVLPNVDHRPIQDTERDLDYLARYRVGLGTLEKLTGLTFMTALNDRTREILEEECPATMLH